MALKCSDDELNDAVRRYVAGEGMEAICEGIRGLGPDRLKQTLINRGLYRSKAERYQLASEKISATQRANSGIDDDAVVAYYLAGNSEKATAAHFGVSRTAIRLRLLSAGVTPRDGSASMHLRLSKMTPDERAALLTAAHEASRGRVVPEETLIKLAETRQRMGFSASDHEMDLAELLRERGLEAVPQFAVGKYNIDLAVHPVAVEVWGGGWHFYGEHARRHAQRTRDLFDAGWHLFIVVVDAIKRPLSAVAADQIVTFVEQARRDPSARREQRVIWGDGEPVPAHRLDFDKAA